MRLLHSDLSKKHSSIESGSMPFYVFSLMRECFFARLLLAISTVCGAAFPVSAVRAQKTATLNSSGNWNDPSIWITVPAGNYPNNDNPNLGDTWDVTVGNGSSVTVNQNITINDLNWSQGTVGGPNSLDLLGTSSTWSSSSTKDINSTAANLTNSGTINLTGTNVRSFAPNSGLTNLSGGTFNIASDGNALINFNNGTFNNNAGATFEKSAGTGTSNVNWAFNNSGNVSAQSGTLALLGGGNYGGSSSVTNGATLNFAGGNFTLQNLGSTTGAGTVSLSGATLNLDNNATFTSGAYLNQTSGTLASGGNSSSSLVLNGNYDWSAGTLGGNGSVSINGGNNIWSSSSVKDIAATAANVTNSGTINLTGTNVRSLAPNSGLTNLSGGTFNISSDGNALINFNNGTFNNNAGATFEKSAGTGTSNVNWAFNNSGLTQATSGTLNFVSSFSQSATGSLKVDGATIHLPGSVSLQGNLLGAGTIDASIINHQNGAISPGLSPGTLAFTGSLNLASSTALNYELGTLSDLVTVGGNLTLDGTLNVTAIAGFSSGLYPLIQYTGTLTDNGLSLGSMPAGYTYQLINDTDHHVVELQVVPEPSSVILILLGAGTGVFFARRKTLR
jgi:fibronectin-binding autotransporter adhesin